MKPTPPSTPTSEETPEPSPDFSVIQQRVFASSGNRIFIGQKELSKDVRDLLREQAKYVSTSQLWEILNASILQEASNLALIQSKDWSHVEFAKALKHWQHFMENTIHTLSQD